VEGTLAFGKTSPFAGRRLSVGLGRSVTSAGFPPCRSAHRRQRVSEGRRGGERCQRAPSSARTTAGFNRHAVIRHVLHSVLRPALVKRHLLPRRKSREVARSKQASRSGKPAQAGGTGTGAVRVDAARLAARHRSRKGEAWRVRKGRRSRPPSLREARVRVWLPARRNAVAEIGRRHLVSNTLGKRAPKRAVSAKCTGA
jgi:hypothetical protein